MTNPEVVDQDRLLALAKKVGDDWTEGPYYDAAEPAMGKYWDELIWPIIKDCDFTTVVEIGAGHGRNSEKLRHLAGKIYLVDINAENVQFLKERFAGADNVQLVLNNGVTIDDVPDGSATFVYSFDSMVHFDSDVVRAYLKEFCRVLKPGGLGFCHYSNYTGNPTGSYRDHPAWRNFMSRELFEHFAAKEGLASLRSELFDWGRDGTFSDALTLFRRP